MAQYCLNEQLGINMKLGIEQSFGDYRKRELTLELALNYQILKEAG